MHDELKKPVTFVLDDVKLESTSGNHQSVAIVAIATRYNIPCSMIATISAGNTSSITGQCFGMFALFNKATAAGGGTVRVGCITHTENLCIGAVVEAYERHCGARVTQTTHLGAKLFHYSWTTIQQLLCDSVLDLTHLPQSPKPSSQKWTTELRLAAHFEKILPILPGIVTKMALRAPKRSGVPCTNL